MDNQTEENTNHGESSVLTLMSGVSAGDHRLSLLLSQAMGSQYCRDLLALQLADWNRMQNDCYLSEERLRIFALLAGKPVRRAALVSFSVATKCLTAASSSDVALFPLLSPQVWQSTDSVINVCSQLDWKRSLAVHLWFMLPPTSSVADALAKYEDAFQVSGVAAWVEGEVG